MRPAVACLGALLGFVTALPACLPTTPSGQPNNVVVYAGLGYVSLGETGLGILDLASRELIRLPPPPGLGSIDDLAIADGLLFVLDAQPPGSLGVLSLASPRAPTPEGDTVAVPVGPFSGVSAAAGRVVVSGGTDDLTVHGYDGQGRLAGEPGRIDLGRGQPDVLLAGRSAYVSTHFFGNCFGLSVLTLEAPPAAPRPGGRVPLPGAGFTAGGAGPANFPIASALVGATLLVASGGGLAVIDVRDADSPLLLDMLPPVVFGVRPVAVAAAGRTAVVVGSDPRPMLAVLDVEESRAPRVVRMVPLPEEAYATGVALSEAGDLAVVAAHAAGTLVLQARGASR